MVMITGEIEKNLTHIFSDNFLATQMTQMIFNV